MTTMTPSDGTLPPEARHRLRSGPVMVVNLAAIQANFRHLSGRSAGRTAAVVKGDGYGHGMLPSALALQEAGARLFFAARLDDAHPLRQRLAPDATVSVLDGAQGETMADALAAGIVPVLNGPNSWPRPWRWRGRAASGSRLSSTSTPR